MNIMKTQKGIMTSGTGPNLSLRKGITPVIAVVLLLMITVALIGFAFIWFQGVWTSVAESTESNIESEVNRMTQTVKIDTVNVAGDVIYIRATGSSNIDVADITVYVGADASSLTLVTCDWPGDPDITSIAAKAVEGCTITTDIQSGDTVKVTSPGTSQGDVVTVS